MTDQVIVRCVRSSVTSTRTSVPLLEACEGLKTIAEEVMWFSEEECLTVRSKNNTVVYLFEKFEGDAFQHLSKLGCRIFGSICVLHCLEKSKPLPKVQHPVYSLTMDDLVVCCSSINQSERLDIYNKVSWMCGRSVRSFDELVSHLVCGEVGSKKYQMAALYKKKIVTPNWVNDLWEQSHTSFVRGNDPICEMKYRCPVFKGLVITVSGIADRDKVRADIEKEGGRYSGEMKMKECTHLVVSEPKGQKYEVALKWKLNIVTPQWIYDSLREGYCLCEEKYAVSKDSVANTKPSTSTPTRLSAGASSTMLGNISSITAVNVDETALNNDTTGVSLIDRLLQSSRHDLPANQADEGLFLDGCKIVLLGFKGSQQELMRKIVNMGGGIRLNELSERVTHVVTVDSEACNVGRQMTEKGWRPFIVSGNWLADCAQSHCRKPVAPHVLFEYTAVLSRETVPLKGKNDMSNSTSMIPDVAASNSRKRQSTEPIEHENNRKQPSVISSGKGLDGLKGGVPSAAIAGNAGVSRADDREDDMDEMMSHYLPTSGVTTGGSTASRPVMPSLGDSTIIAAAAANGLTAMDNATSRTTTEHAVDDDTTFVDNEDVPKLIFKKKTFIVGGFMPEDEADVENEIVQNGGLMFVPGKAGQKKADYGIVPIVSSVDPLPATEVVTNAWMIMCLEAESLLPPSSCPVFSSFDIKAGDNCLEGVVLSISGISGAEREAYVLIAESLGACYQEYFVHKQVRDLHVSTHLISKEASGTKFEAAMKWKLPVVSKMWLVECAKQRKRVSEAEYLMSAETAPGGGGVVLTPVRSHAVNPAATVPTSNGDKNQMASGGRADAAQTRSVLRDADVTPNKVPTASASTAEKTARSSKAGNKQALRAAEIANSATRSGKATGFASPTRSQQRRQGGRRPKFSFGAALQYLDSQDDNRRASVGLDVLLDQGLKQAIITSRPAVKDTGTPRQDRDDLGQTQKAVLHGVVIAVAKKLCAQQIELNAIAVELGADYRWTLDSLCTHFVFQGKPNDTNKEYRTASEQGKKIVSPHWLYACKEENVRKEESAYPHTYNPNMALAVIATPRRAGTRSSQKPKTPGPMPLPSAVVGTTSSDEQKQSEKSDDNVVPAAANGEDYTEKLKALLDSSKATRSLRKRAKYLASENLPMNSNALPAVMRSRDSGAVSSPESSRPAAAAFDAPAESQQEGEVGWDDGTVRQHLPHPAAAPGHTAADDDSPDSKKHSLPLGDSVDPLDNFDAILQARQKAAQSRSNAALLSGASLSAKSSPVKPSVLKPIQPSVTSALRVESPAVSRQATTSAAPVKRIFLFSGMSPQERDEYGAVAEQLGGIVYDCQSYDPRSTHLVASSVVRNEKFLACVAAGKWVMHKSYFEASRDSGKFVDESDHEWGGSASMSSLATLGPQITRMAMSARKWRRQIADVRKSKPAYAGAFDGWHVMLLVEKKKEEQFKRLLEAGGARVLITKTPPESWKDITHAFVEPAKLPNDVKFIQSLAAAGVACLKPDYIAAYLLDDPVPRLDQFLAIS